MTHWFPNSEAQKRNPVLSTHILVATETVSKYFIRISVTYQGGRRGGTDGKTMTR